MSSELYASAGTKIAGTRPAVNGGVRIITVELNRLRDYYGKSKSDNTVRPYRARCARYNSIAAGTGVSVTKLIYKHLLPSGFLRRTNICVRKIPDRRTNEKEGYKP